MTNQLLTPSPRIVNEIRAHLEARGHGHEHWEVPSLTGDPRCRVAIVASRDQGERGRGWRRSYAHSLHLSFMARVGGVPVAVLDEDLDGWGMGVLGAMARYATIQWPAESGDALDLTPWSRLITHARVYLDRKTRPLLPTGDFADVRWAA